MRRALRSARGLPLPSFGHPPSATMLADVPAVSQPQPISSDKTIAMSSPAPMSDGPTLESAVQPRPPMPKHVTERLSPGLLGAQQTMHLQPQLTSSHPRVSTAPPHHVSSGSMPSAHPAPQQPPQPPQMNMGSSGSYPFQRLPLPPAPEPQAGGRGPLVASALFLAAVLAFVLYLYLRGMPHLP